MKKLFILLSILALVLQSCVSESDHQSVIHERNNLSIENRKLKSELEEIKFGASNLLSDGEKFYLAKDFSQARQKFKTLLEKHPDMIQSIEAKKYLAIIDEEEMWQTAYTSKSIKHYENYIANYPKGKYIKNAISRVNGLKKLNMQKAYDNALSNNSSYTWKNFLKQYPDHPNENFIKEKIIRLEVEEIIGSSETGQMPSFNSFSTSYSSNSSVEIKNNTGCNLTVRYSGVEARIIEIPNGGTRTVNLKSGKYKIGASACGSNYAGAENLQGKYGSTFYIKTTQYR